MFVPTAFPPFTGFCEHAEKVHQNTDIVYFKDKLEVGSAKPLHIVHHFLATQ